MKAVVVQHYGPAEDFSVAEWPTPQPGPGEVRIRIAAAGISFVDLLTAAGQYQIKPPLPFVPGSEIAGTVEAIGPGVIGFKPGDRVCAATPSGAWAEQVCVPETRAMAIPASLSFAQAAVFQVPYSTALLGLQLRGNLRPGETLMVTGAAGSVGLAAIQIGKLLGARVIAGASSPQKREAALKAGADDVIDSSGEGWTRSLKTLAPAGVNLVFDPVGGPWAEALFRTLAWGGRYLMVGFAGGSIPSFAGNWPLLKGAALVGVNVGAFNLHEPAAARGLLQQLALWLEQGRLAPPIAATFALQDFLAATHLASARETVGRVVLTME